MKIGDILASQLAAGKSKGTAKQSSETNFQDILKSHLQSPSPLELSGTAQVQKKQAVSTALRVESLGLTESAIDTLDSYSTALSNAALSHVDLEPYVSTLEEEASALLAIKEQLPQEDPLAKLLDRVATVAYLEIAKYRRGDYNL